MWLWNKTKSFLDGAGEFVGEFFGEIIELFTDIMD